MRQHVIVRTDPADEVPIPDNEPCVDVSVFADHQGTVSDTVAETLSRLGLNADPTASELALLATAVFHADLRVPRSTALDRWTREFSVSLPVRNPDQWNDCSETIEEALAFLTGDRWTLHFRRGVPSFYGSHPRTIALLQRRPVTLFSGGLDSFIGAYHNAQIHDDLTLVGHHASSNGVLADQHNALLGLQAATRRQDFTFADFYLTKKRGILRRSELTTRSRSIVFLALGILVAASAGPGSTLYVPENGFVSLNVPLVYSRLGSHSTRTTHPFFMARIREILRKLDINVGIELPLRHSSKGKILRDVGAEVREIARTHTVSCAHPVNQRESRPEGYKRNCGYCFPCLVRRAAFNSVGMDYADDYRQDVLSPLTDSKYLINLHAIRIAVEKFRSQPTSALSILVSGPLPVDGLERERYVDMWREGMEELRQWLRQV